MSENLNVVKVNFRKNNKKLRVKKYELTEMQKYELAIIELVYNIKPFKYEQIFNFKSAQEFIKKHKTYIDENIVIEKYMNENSYVCDKHQNFYGVIYKEDKGDVWNNTYYIKNELLDMDPKDAEDIYCAVIMAYNKNKISLREILLRLGFLGLEISESKYVYINKLIEKINHKIPIGDYMISLNEHTPDYYPF